MPYIGRNPDKGNFSDLNGAKLIIDADADTSITADTDDTIDIEIAGADDFQFTANTFTVLSGSTLTIASGATIANSGTATGFSSADPTSADGDTLGTASAEWSDLYLAESGVIYFGNDQDVTVTHDPDDGLFLKSTATADNNPFVLTLQTGEIDIAADDIIGQIDFQAPDEGAGTDAILVAGSIRSVSEGDFSASNNATSLNFFTGKSAAAGTDGGSLILGSTGNLTLKDLATADGSSPTLTLQTGDTDMAADDILGKIAFQAPDEGAGTDAILVSAAIQARSETDFSSSANATSIDFMVGSSEAAATKMTLNSTGNLSVGDGTAALPSYSNTGDLNTGVYFPAADTVGVTAGGTEQFRFGSNPIPGGSKNMLINGAMTITQKGSVADMGNPSGPFFCATDMWRVVEVGMVARFTSSQDTTSPAGFGYSLKCDCTTAESSTAVGDILVVSNRIEAQNLQHLQYGAAAAEAMTLSFWFRSPKSGTHCVALYQNDGNRSYVSEFTISSADTFEFFSIAIPGDASGTINNDTGQGLEIAFPFVAGSNWHASADAWASGQDYATSNQQDLMDNTANNVYIAGVQLEVGSVPTDFAHEDNGTTLAKCQRYYFQTNLFTSATRFGTGGYDASNSLGSLFHFPTEMRAAPTVAFTSSVFRSAHDGAVHDDSITLAITAQFDGYFPMIGTQATVQQGDWYWIIDNSADASNGQITFTAEL